MVGILNSKDVSEKLRELRLEPGATGPADTARFFVEEAELWSKVIRQANITATDLLATNGVIHVIDKVILPPAAAN